MSENIWNKIDEKVGENFDFWVEQLGRLCAQPSVSAQNLGIAECAELVGKMLEEQGIRSEIMSTGGHPIVFGHADGGHEKTLLFYLHYDVQPPEPLDLWHSSPFELTRRGDKFYARGVCDDKGHIITRLAALDAVRQALGDLPVNVKFIIEGEEEVGSPHMPGFVEAHQELLAADACIWEFGGVDFDGRPSQSLGMRGICYVELSVQTAVQDAHSGLGGSLFPNAAWRLVWALNTLKDEYEKILIPGFYEDVLPPTKRDLALLEDLPDESEKLMEMYQLDGYLKGMTGGLAWKRAAVFEPTCTICGLDSGYQGPGSKTVLPAKASAKVDFRLVPDQKPDDILVKLRSHLDAQGFQDVQVTYHGGGRPAKVDPDDPFVKIAVDTAVSVYGQEPVVAPIIGGSGPNYPFIHVLDLPLVSAGIGYPGTQIHAPNENIRVNDLVNGIRHTARIVELLGRK